MTFTERNKNAIEFSLWRWWKNYTWAKFLFFISPFVTILVILSIFLLPTMWGKCGATVDYHIVGTTLYIEGVGRMDQFYGKDPPWWPWHNIIRKIEISDGVNGIGLYAFYEFKNLRSVEIPSSVKSIGAWAFQRCEKLDELQASGVTIVGRAACAECTSLGSVQLCQTDAIDLGEEAFQRCESLVTFSSHPVVNLDDRCFDGCEKLDGLEYLNPVRVGQFALSGCVSLSSFPMMRTSDALTTSPGRRPLFGTGAFLNCTSLTQAVLPEGVTVVPEAMFKGCTSLLDVTLPEGITTISEGAFYGCTALESLILPESLRRIEKDAFTDCVSLSMLVIPDETTRIDRTAFRRWTAEQTVLLPSLDLMPQGAAYSDARLEEKEKDRESWRIL